MREILESARRGIGQGLGIGIGLLLLLGTALLAQTLLQQFESGEQLTAKKLNENFSALASAQVPVGTIVAWHKSLTGTPGIPANWVECNGQTLSDSSSVYNGQTIPDLNGGGRFLRGSATSGTLQADAFQGHYHFRNPSNVHEYNLMPGGPADYMSMPCCGFWTGSPHQTTGAATAGSNGTPRTESETRPVNMSVVWIMKTR